MTDTSDLGTVDKVLLALGDPDGETYSREVIQRKLTAARIIVENRADESASKEMLREAVIALAAYKTYNASPHAVQKEAAGVSKKMNVESYLVALRESADDALDAVEGGVATFQVF